MENLECYGVLELKREDIKEVNGGFLAFLGGFLLGSAIAMLLFDKKQD
ncbi:hypothetical protein [Flagellimonas beolgyonensis]|nr:hypothetical protein [Allomuricauda beolgyonensis]